ncbi:MAG TPA: deoxyribonuclease IV [Erysipelotrichaceae bacterium]|nr:deoxyribonuclease IV [Erysipelotrichaceae bacterium]
MIIGSHVSMSAPDYFLGAVKEAISYHANALMIYTGAPQNTVRKPVEDLRIEEGLAVMEQAGISKKNLIVHAPYIINLANTVKEDTFTLAVDFLKKEIDRSWAMQARTIVLHPGAHVGAGEEVGIDRIVEGLDLANQNNPGITIALETMAGKGTEIGLKFEDIAAIRSRVKRPELIEVCLDTCHVHDAGYDVQAFSELLDEFDRVIGLNHLAVIHINDSKNIRGARKDRHENLGYGEIGFELFVKVMNEPRLASIPKILETPYVDGVPPYQKEIQMLKMGIFDDWK